MFAKCLRVVIYHFVAILSENTASTRCWERGRLVRKASPVAQLFSAFALRAQCGTGPPHSQHQLSLPTNSIGFVPADCGIIAKLASLFAARWPHLEVSAPHPVDKLPNFFLNFRAQSGKLDVVNVCRLRRVRAVRVKTPVYALIQSGSPGLQFIIATPRQLVSRQKYLFEGCQINRNLHLPPGLNVFEFCSL